MHCMPMYKKTLPQSYEKNPKGNKDFCAFSIVSRNNIGQFLAPVLLL